MESIAKLLNNKIKESDKSFYTNKQILIYGNGVNGKKIYEFLKCKNCKIVGFYDDKHYCNSEDINIYSGETIQQIVTPLKNIVVVIAFFVKDMKTQENIKKKLVKQGFTYDNIKHFLEVSINSFIDVNKIFNNKNEIVKAYDMLADDESKNLFYNYFNAVINQNVDLFSLPVENEQYFDKDIISKYNWKNNGGYFVDCGSYIGDTFEVFKDMELPLNYIGIEPDINNFNLLAQRVKDYPEFKPILYPCATSQSNSLVHFSYSDKKSDSPGSSISEEGTCTIPCARLDSIVGGINIEMIKMDVEGAEYDTILGAKDIINKQKPVLSICTYHLIEDMWRLENLIKEYQCEYKFYLRSYYLYGRETVLYGIPK